jgi:hypothetical protein
MHSLYLPHREKKTKREGREAAITTVFVGEEGSQFRLKRKAGYWSERTKKNGIYEDNKEERCLTNVWSPESVI